MPRPGRMAEPYSSISTRRESAGFCFAAQRKTLRARRGIAMAGRRDRAEKDKRFQLVAHGGVWKRLRARRVRHGPGRRARFVAGGGFYSLPLKDFESKRLIAGRPGGGGESS